MLMFVQVHSDISPTLVIGQPPSLNQVFVTHDAYNGYSIRLFSSDRPGTGLTAQSGIILKTAPAVVFGGICATTIATKKDPSRRRKSEDIMTICQAEYLGRWGIRRMVKRYGIRAAEVDSRTVPDNICLYPALPTTPLVRHCISLDKANSSWKESS